MSQIANVGQRARANSFLYVIENLAHSFSMLALSCARRLESSNFVRALKNLIWRVCVARCGFYDLENLVLQLCASRVSAYAWGVVNLHVVRISVGCAQLPSELLPCILFFWCFQTPMVFSYEVFWISAVNIYKSSQKSTHKGEIQK